jgi:crotonobetainyl-CoA:carnitine CoA-transferase CaiB-like acyl-CoA transferase
MDEVFADPQIVARGVRVDLAEVEAAGGHVPGVAGPVVIDGVRQVAMKPSPRMGGDAVSVLADPAWGG